MQKPSSPIRRYVLLGHRDHGSPVRRWSLERIASAPRAEGRELPDARSAGK